MVHGDIGMPIFDRSVRPVGLTPAGAAYLAHIKRLHAMEEELRLELEDIQNAKTGHIKIGGSHYINAYILPELLASFMKQYPGISVEITEASSAELAELLSQQEIDVTFNCNPAFMQGFKKYPAFTDHVLLAVPKSRVPRQFLRKKAIAAEDILKGRHLAADCPQISLAELQELDYILLSAGNNLRERSLQLFQEAGFAPKIKMELAQMVTTYHLAAAGIGAAFISDSLVSPAIKGLAYYKLDSELTTRQFYALLPKRKYTSIAVQAFIRYIKEHMMS